MEAVRPSPFLSRISYKVLTYLESYFLDEGVAHSAIAKDAATATARERESIVFRDDLAECNAIFYAKFITRLSAYICVMPSLDVYTAAYQSC